MHDTSYDVCDILRMLLFVLTAWVLHGSGFTSIGDASCVCIGGRTPLENSAVGEDVLGTRLRLFGEGLTMK